MKLSREVKIGIFAVTTLLALYWGLNFLKGQDLFSSNNTYYATYEQVNGIQKASAIVIKGFKVGVISDISYDPSKSDQIVLGFSIKSKYKIPDNSKARIYSDGLLGGKAVEIELGTSDRYLSDGDTLRSEMGKGFFEMAGSELEFLKQKAGVLVEDVTQTLANINALLTENQKSINASLNNIAALTGSLNQVVGSESGSVRSVMRNMETITETLSNNSDKIEGIIANVGTFTDSLSRSDIPAVVANLSSTLSQLNNTLASVNDGEGSLGKLLSDEELYDELVRASGNLALLLEDLRVHPGRYLNISVFGSRNK